MDDPYGLPYISLCHTAGVFYIKKYICAMHNQYISNYTGISMCLRVL